MIERARLGRTPVEVTRLGFGSAGIGNLYRAVDDVIAGDAVSAAWAAGVRYFDTAPHYGLGLSETRLGRALAGRPRAEFAVSTKVGRRLVANPSPTGSDLERGGFDVPDDRMRVRDYSADGVRRSIESSLERLGLDHIDIAFVHDPEHDMDQALAEALPALVALRDEGVVGAVGAGMNLVEPLRRFVAETDVDVVMLAGRWTLIDRTGEPLLDEAAQRGVAVIAAAPFNSGLLSRPEVPPDARFDYTVAPPELVARLRGVAGRLAAAGAALPHAALQFPLRHPAVTSVVAGMTTAAEVRDDTALFTEPIADATWRTVDDDLVEVLRWR